MSPETPEGDPLDQSDRRRSVRAKRDKPDYYDALDYDSKRQKTPKQGQKRGSFSSRMPQSQARRPMTGYGYIQQTSRATMSWKKTTQQEEDEHGKNKNTNGARREESEETLDYLEEITPEKVFSCAV